MIAMGRWCQCQCADLQYARIAAAVIAASLASALLLRAVGADFQVGINSSTSLRRQWHVSNDSGSHHDGEPAFHKSDPSAFRPIEPTAMQSASVGETAQPNLNTSTAAA